MIYLIPSNLIGIKTVGYERAMTHGLISWNLRLIRSLLIEWRISMRLTTKGRYGLRAVVDLAVNTDDEAIALSRIAERQGISMNYLEQLVARLRKSGIVNGIRGAQGGYVLAMPAEEISVGDILRALEGDLSPVDCYELNSNDTPCDNSDICVTKYVWKRISNSINDAVDGIMLSDLVAESKRVQAVKGIKQENHTKQTC